MAETTGQGTTGAPAGGGKPAAGTGGLGRAVAWMLGLSLALFWLPVLGMFIAGLVGGRKAGGVGTAVLAVMVPALVVGAVMFFAGTLLTGMPVLGTIAALGAGALVLANVLPMLAGAVLGGILS